MNDFALLAIISTVVFLLLAIFIVSFALFFQRRQLENMQEKVKLQAAFEEEILKAQLEVQNQTLQRIARELHDNIGQLLSVTKLYLYQAEDLDNLDDVHTLTVQANMVVDKTVEAVRSLTKSLDGDFVQDFGIVQTLEHEIKRLNIPGKFTATFSVSGKAYSLGFDREIVLFRVVQEIINNMLKHARAHSLQVSITFETARTILKLVDNGCGFDYEQAINQQMEQSGAGLRNIQRRIELISGICTYDTAPGCGTAIHISLPAKTVSA